MIAIGADHGGYSLKEEIIEYLSQNNMTYKDFGIFNNYKCDYPIIAQTVAKAVASFEYNFGILFCGTGLGMSIAANKITNIRAVCATDIYSVKYSRLHNNANILCLGGRVIGAGLAKELINVFLNSDFEGGRHQSRINMLEKN